jgi:hypothetical protein
VCHRAQAEAFASSRHARATTSELFQALRARSGAQQGFCDSCHAPHTADGESGVGCVTCHTAIGNRGTSNARLIHDESGPQRGPFADAVTTRAHGSARSDVVLGATLCGTCHEVEGPGAFTETPHTEWSRSPAAQQGITCADCHMSPRPGVPNAARARGAAALAGPQRPLADHSFVGVDHARATELLADTAAVEVRIGARSGQTLEVEVTVQNRNLGHALPSGARFAREAWIEIVARDALGREHTVSGALDARGAPVTETPARVDLGEVVTDPRALFEGPALPHHAIPAGGEASFAYAVPVEWEGSATVTVRARLRFRRNAWALRAALGLAPDTTAPFDLATATAMVPPSP